MNCCMHLMKQLVSILSEIHPEYADEIKDNIRVRIGNYAVQKGLSDINADVINKLLEFQVWWSYLLK